MIFAHIGDRIGRKKTLVLTLSLMGSATVAIGLLPTYEMVGLWAPALLITLRIIQGMGIGGEWGGALLLAYEYAPEKRKGFFGSIPCAGVTIGMLMATFIVSLMTLFDEAQFLARAGAYRSCSAPSSFFSACGSAKISTKRPPLSR